MLTEEEIRNLRIGDEIYIEGELQTVELLSIDNIGVVNSHVLYGHCFLQDPDNFVYLKPPVKKKKYWLYVVKIYESCPLKINPRYFDVNGISTDGMVDVNYFHFAQKLDYTMIEVSE